MMRDPLRNVNHLKPCVLCGNVLLPKKYIQRAWIHIFCIYVWGVGKYKNGKLIIENPEAIYSAKSFKEDLKCKFCKQSTGLMKQCSYMSI